MYSVRLLEAQISVYSLSEALFEIELKKRLF